MVCFECWKFQGGAIVSGRNDFRAHVHKRPLTQPTKIVHPVCKVVVSWWMEQSKEPQTEIILALWVQWLGMAWVGCCRKLSSKISPSFESQPSCHVPKGMPLLTSCWCYWGRRVLWGMAVVAAGGSWNQNARESTCCSEQLLVSCFGDMHAGTWISSISPELLESSQWVSGGAGG